MNNFPSNKDINKFQWAYTRGSKRYQKCRYTINCMEYIDT